MNDNVDDIVTSDADNDIIESHLTTEGTIRYTHAHKQLTSRQEASSLYPTFSPFSMMF